MRVTVEKNNLKKGAISGAFAAKISISHKRGERGLRKLCKQSCRYWKISKYPGRCDFLRYVQFLVTILFSVTRRTLGWNMGTKEGGGGQKSWKTCGRRYCKSLRLFACSKSLRLIACSFVIFKPQSSKCSKNEIETFSKGRYKGKG